MAGVPSSECVNEASDRFKMTGIPVLRISIQLSMYVCVYVCTYVRMCKCTYKSIYVGHCKFRV